MGWLIVWVLLSSNYASALKVTAFYDTPFSNFQPFQFAQHLGLQKAASKWNSSIPLTIQEFESLDYSVSSLLPQIFRTIQEKSADFMLFSSFSFGDVVKNLSQTFPSQKILFSDSMIDPPTSNVVGLLFKQDEPSFLAGALGGMLSKTKIIGVAAGLPISPVLDFVTGFRTGVSATCPDCIVYVVYHKGFAEFDAANRTAHSFLRLGVDFAFGVGGATGTTCIHEMAKFGALVVGVDLDEFIFSFRNGTVAGAQQVVTSVVKNLDLAIFATLSEIFSRENITADLNYEGGVKLFDFKSGGAGLSPCHQACSLYTSEINVTLGRLHLQLTQGIVDTNTHFLSGRALVNIIQEPESWNRLFGWGVPPEPRASHVQVVHNGSLFIHGGFSLARRIKDDLWAFDMGFGEWNSGNHWWTKLTPRVSVAARYAHTAVVYLNTMFMFGGTLEDTDSSSVKSGEMIAYHFENNSYSILAVHPVGRSGHTSAVDAKQGIIYTFGGITTERVVVSQVLAYHIATNKFEVLNTSGSVPVGKIDSASAFFDNKFYVFGGQTITSILDSDLFVLDIATNVWTKISPSLKPNSRRSATLLASTYELYLWGGVGNAVFNDLWVFDLDLNMWLKKELIGLNVPAGRTEHSASIHNQSGKLLLSTYGGITAAAYDPIVWIYVIREKKLSPREYFVCEDKAKYVDPTGRLPMSREFGRFDVSYYCDSYVDCENYYDEGFDCSPSRLSVLTAFAVISGVFLIFVIVCGSIFFFRRTARVIKAASWSFHLVIAFGTLVTVGGIFPFYPQPTNALCSFRPWLLAIGFDLVYGCLFAKTFRIYRIFSSATDLASTQLSTGYVIFIEGLILTPTLIMLIIFSSSNASETILRATEGRMHYECYCSTTCLVISILLILHKGLLLVFGTYLAYKTRTMSISKVFDDSSYISLCIYNLIILAIIFIPLLYLVNNNPVSWLILFSIGVLGANIITMILIFLPRIWNLYHEETKITSTPSFDARKWSTAGNSSVKGNSVNFI